MFSTHRFICLTSRSPRRLVERSFIVIQPSPRSPGPVCEVVTVAKRDLKAGERLDGIGGFCSYGLIDNASAARAIAALPIGLSEGCVLRRDVSKDAVVTFNDVDTPPAGLVETLWQEQAARWPLATKESEESSLQHAPAGRSR